MLIRERSTVIQLYRSVYDRETMRSRTVTLGSFAKAAEPGAELLARLTDPERAALARYLAQRNAQAQAQELPQLLAAVPAAMRRIAAWMRNEPKTPELKRSAKALRDAYGELYGVMAALGMSRLRESRPTAAPERAKPARQCRRPADAVSDAAAGVGNATADGDAASAGDA